MGIRFGVCICFELGREAWRVGGKFEAGEGGGGGGGIG